MLVLEYIKNILDKPLTKEERVQLNSLCQKAPDAMCDTAFKLAWSELKKRLNSQELSSYPMGGILELGNISYDILLSSICKLMKESKNGWEEKVIDNLSDKNFDIFYRLIERYQKKDKADANVEALKKVKLKSTSFFIPKYAGEYCFQALSNAPHFPWGKRSNASVNEVCSYDNFNKMWRCLYRANIPDWYEYEKYTGFNLTLYLLYLCKPRFNIRSKVFKNLNNYSVKFKFKSKIVFKNSDKYNILKKCLNEIKEFPALKIMHFLYYRCFIMKDLLAGYEGRGSFLSGLPLTERFTYLENIPFVKHYAEYEELFLKWVVWYMATLNDKKEDITNEVIELLKQEFLNRVNHPIDYLFDFMPLQHYSNTDNGTTTRSNINKYFVNIHELVYKVVSKI